MKIDMTKESGNQEALKLLRRINLTKKQVTYINSRFTDYILFRNKSKQGYCTACHQELKGTFKHNDTCRCPECGKKVVCKSEGMIQKIQDYYTMQFQNVKGGTLVVIMESWMEIKKYSLNELIENKGPQKEYAPVAVYCFSQEEQCAYFRYNYAGWGKNQTVCIKGGLEHQYIKVDQDNFGKTLGESHLRYIKSYIEYAGQGYLNDPSGILKRMDLCSKYPQVEILYKMGFRRIIDEKLYRCKNYRAVNWRAGSPEKLLKITKAEIKMLGQYNPGHYDLAILQRTRKEGNPVKSIGELETLKRMVNIEEDAKALNYTTLQKLYNYFSRSLSRTRESCGEMALNDHAWKGTYRDYVRMAEKLGYDLSDPYYLMPKKMGAAHDRVTEEYNRRREEEEQKERKEKEKKWENAIKRLSGCCFENDTLLIRPPESMEELRKEGVALHHCVGSYCDRVITGESGIFLIREKGCPGKPFYTLELSPQKKLRQCRGNKNCGMTVPVKAFVDEWLETIQRKTKKRKKEAA